MEEVREVKLRHPPAPGASIQSLGETLWIMITLYQHNENLQNNGWMTRNYRLIHLLKFSDEV